MKPDASISNTMMIRYGAGQLGAQVFRDTPAVLLPIFMTTMLGVPAWLAGLAVLVPKLWVLCCDPLVGAWSDRTKHGVGRRPFMLVGAFGTGVGFLCLFALTKFPSPLLATATLCALYLAASTAFSCFSVPYLAVASEMSHDPHERTRLLTFRMAFTVGGVVLGVGVAQPIVFYFGGGALGWHIMAVVFAAICLASMLIAATSPRGVRVTEIQTAPPRLLSQLSSVFSNRPFCILLATSFTQSVSQACGYTVIGFFFLYVLHNVKFILVFVLVMSTGSLISQPMWLALSRRFGKERCFVAAYLVFMCITVTWIFVHPGVDVLVTLPVLGKLSTQEVLVMARAIGIGLCNAGFVLLTLSMLTDTIDLERKTHGMANEGVFSGLFSAAEKLAFATGPVIAGIVLSLCGFASSIGGAKPQGPQAVFGIKIMYSMAPASILLISLAVFSFYGAANSRSRAKLAQTPSMALS
jgi:GPH family glycoside/pentoside/hexuronide:cation symporter